MTLPAEFSHVEHLQSAIRKWVNREVREYFSDVGDDSWDPDITTPRGSLRTACTHIDSDSLNMTQLRWQLFERIRRSAFDMPYFGIPVSGLNRERRFKPQIVLYFQEDVGDVEPTFSPVDGRISFRLMEYTESSVNPTVAQTFANRIQTNFGIGGGYIWRKGRVMCTYTDPDRGYGLQLLVRDETYGRDLIERVLDVQNHSPDWSKMNVKENQNPAEAYPPIPPNKLVYGESRRTSRRRPVADVRFQVSFLNLEHLSNPVTLYDRTDLYPSALAS